MEAVKSEKPTRGYVDGCWDIMHSGHFNAIRQAKSVCDVLVVGIHSDKEIEENKALPVMREKERYGLLEHIKWIDEIIHDVPYSPEISTLERANADFCIHGDDMPVNSEGVCAYDGMRLAGKLRIIKRTEGVSTTDLIGRLLTLSRQPHLPFEATPELLKTLPVRLHAEDAIQQLTPPPSPRLLPLSSPNGGYGGSTLEAVETANALIEKYNMTLEDAEALRRVIGVAPLSEQSNSFATPEKIRTKAPVHLLTSTRRVMEFASSRQPGQRDRVVYVRGSFDMFHVGHAQFLKDARALGSFLLVGIQEDSVVRQAKGANFPVMSLTERILNVCACKWVDEVIIGAPLNVTEDLIKTWDIKVVARGIGYKKSRLREPVVDPFLIPRQANICIEVPSQWPDLCHDTIVQRIMDSRQVYMRRNADRATREDVYYDQKFKTELPSEC